MSEPRKMNKPTRHLTSLAMLFGLLLMSGCGGGGSGVIANPPPSGTLKLLAGAVAPGATCSVADGSPGSARFGNITTITVGKDGTSYLIDKGCAATDLPRLRKVTSNGQVSTLAVGAPAPVWGLPGKTLTSFGAPLALALDSMGNVFVLDQTPDADVCTLTCVTRYDDFAQGQLPGIWKVAPDGVTTLFAGVMYRSPTGELDGVGERAGFKNPSHITIDADNTIYVADAGKIRKISTNATVTTLANAQSAVAVYADATGSAFVLLGNTGNGTCSETSTTLLNLRSAQTSHVPCYLYTLFNPANARYWSVAMSAPDRWYRHYALSNYIEVTALGGKVELVVGNVGTPNQTEAGALPGNLDVVRAIAAGPDKGLYIVAGYALLKAEFTP